MSFAFESNYIFLLITILIAIYSWNESNKEKNNRIRRAFKTMIIFLSFPIVHFGHPIFFYLSWMFPVKYFVGYNYKYLFIYLGALLLAIAITQIGVKNTEYD